MPSTTSANAIEPHIARQAAEWFLLLQSGDATADERAAFTRWRSDPQCERAWQRAEQVGATLGQIPAQLGSPTLRRDKRLDRRAVLKTLTLLIAAPAAGWVAHRQLPWRAWAADYQTGVGERREIVLADGSQLQLNTDSAVDVHFDERERRLKLHRGEILVQTAKNPGVTPRPFIVETRDGRIRALGTRFLVRQMDDATVVTVLEQAVEIQPAGSGATAIIQTGQQTHFSAQEMRASISAPPNTDAWSHGILYADGMPLQTFAAELNRYRSGVVRCHPAVAQLKVSGAFQLRDTDPVLQSLTDALPVQLRYRTRWWVSIEPAV